MCVVCNDCTRACVSDRHQHHVYLNKTVKGYFHRLNRFDLIFKQAKRDVLPIQRIRRIG